MRTLKNKSICFIVFLINFIFEPFALSLASAQEPVELKVIPCLSENKEEGLGQKDDDKWRESSRLILKEIQKEVQGELPPAIFTKLTPEVFKIQLSSELSCLFDKPNKILDEELKDLKAVEALKIKTKAFIFSSLAKPLYPLIEKDPQFITFYHRTGWRKKGLPKFKKWKQKNKHDLRNLSPNELSSPENTFVENFTAWLVDKEYNCRRPALNSFLNQYFNFTKNLDTADCFQLKTEIPLNESEFLFDRLRKDKVDEKGSEKREKINLDPERVLSVEYFLASRGPHGIEQRWGHSMLKVVICPPEEPMTIQCRENIKNHFVLSFKADVVESMLVEGKDGTSRLSSLLNPPLKLYVENYEDVVKEYSEGEKRDLMSLPLELNPKEKRDLIHRSLEVYYGLRGSYNIATNNCASSTYELIQSSLSLEGTEGDDERRKIAGKTKQALVMTPHGFCKPKGGIWKKLEKLSPLWEKILRNPQEEMGIILDHWKEIFGSKKYFIEFLLDYHYLDLQEDEEMDFMDEVDYDPDTEEGEINPIQIQKIKSLLRPEKRVETFLRDLHYLTPSTLITKKEFADEFLQQAETKMREGQNFDIKKFLKIKDIMGIKELVPELLLTVDPRKRILWYQEVWPKVCGKYPELKNSFLEFLHESEDFIDDESIDFIAKIFQGIIKGERFKSNLIFGEGFENELKAEVKKSEKKRSDLVKRIKKILEYINEEKVDQEGGSQAPQNKLNDPLDQILYDHLVKAKEMILMKAKARYGVRGHGIPSLEDDRALKDQYACKLEKYSGGIEAFQKQLKDFKIDLVVDTISPLQKELIEYATVWRIRQTINGCAQKNDCQCLDLQDIHQRIDNTIQERFK